MLSACTRQHTFDDLPPKCTVCLWNEKKYLEDIITTHNGISQQKQGFTADCWKVVDCTMLDQVANGCSLCIYSD